MTQQIGLTSPKSRQIQARLANTKRNRPDDTDAIEELRRQFGAARLEDYITETLATFPPLTNEQKAELTALINGGPR